MATLYIRNFPDEVYECITQLASAHHRSISAEVINLLDEASQREELRQQRAEALQGITSMTLAADTIDSIQLLREDRER